MKEITAAITAFFMTFFARPAAVTTTTNIVPTPTISPQAELRLVNNEVKFKVYEPRFNLSGISARIIYRYAGSLPKVKIEPRGQWVFPVQKVTPDDVTHTVTVEIAALNISPNGYLSPVTEDTLAIINAGKFEDFVIDPNLTKIISKSGQELKVKL